MKKYCFGDLFKRTMISACAVIVACNLKSVNVNADDAIVAPSEGQIFVSNSLVSSDSLLQGYLDQELLKEPATFGLYGSATTTTGSTGALYSKLNDNEKYLYNAVKKDADLVAKGLLANSSFTYTLSQFSFTGNWDKLVNEVLQNIDFESVMNALRLESPYEFYWCGLSYTYTMGLDEKAKAPTYTVILSVGKDFRKSGAKPAFSSGSVSIYTDVDTAKTGATSDAINNAKGIVESHADESDYDKLCAYKEAICDLVSYNYDALELKNEDYGNPWQLIWVFDNDTKTNVVCEGYAKAFQYLCDMTRFQNSRVKSYVVEGLMQGGPHMWNVVTMDDNKNYLVDVTNCDENTAGAPDHLFLVPANWGSAAGGYIVYGIQYIYSNNVLVGYGTDASSPINLSDEPYQSVDLGENILDSIRVYGDLEKSQYTCTESFSSKGLTFAAIYTNGNTVDITSKVTFSSSIKVGQTNVVFSYTENGVTKTVSVNITVGHSGNTVVKNALSATCTTEGYTGDTYCKDCGTLLKKGTSIAKVAHKTKNVVTKATTSKDGKIVTKCTVCNKETKKTVIKKIKSVTLKYTSAVYTGKNLTPAVTVKDSAGKTINAKYYTVKYTNNKAVGTATVTITFKTNYSGTIKKTFTIVPKTTTVSKVTPASKKLTVAVKKQATQTTGYQIQVATDKKFTKNVKTVTISKNTTLSKALTGLKAKTPYYIRVRTYKVVNKKNVYSSWSVYKNVVKTK